MCQLTQLKVANMTCNGPNEANVAFFFFAERQMWQLKTISRFPTTTSSSSLSDLFRVEKERLGKML